MDKWLEREREIIRKYGIAWLFERKRIRGIFKVASPKKLSWKDDRFGFTWRKEKKRYL